MGDLLEDMFIIYGRRRRSDRVSLLVRINTKWPYAYGPTAVAPTRDETERTA